MIRSIFLPNEAKVIMGIALSAHLPDDQVVWVPTPNGRFSVCNAYKVPMEMADRGMKGAVSDDSQLQKFWKYLWWLNIPHKVRHFAWKACKDITPTKENLLKRKLLL